MNNTKMRIMRKTWKAIFTGFVIASLGLKTTGVIGQSVMNLKKAIELSLANSNGLKSDSMNIIAAAYQVKVLKADFLPQLNYAGKTEYNPSIPTQMLPGSIAGHPEKDLVPVKFGTSYSLGSGMELTQNLIKRPLRYQIDNAGINQNIAQTKYSMSREDLVYQVAIAYYSLQTDDELIRTTTKDYQNLLDVVRVAKAQFENGTMKKIDLSSLEINADNKESYLRQLQTQYQNHLIQFNWLLGIPADSKTTIDNSISASDRVIEPGNPFQQRLDLHLSGLMIGSKEMEMRSIRAERLPVISTYVKYNYASNFNHSKNAWDNEYWYNSSTIGISTSIPIFDGNRRRSRISIAQTELQQLRFQQELQQQTADKEWVSANETLKNYRDQLQITNKNLKLAEHVFESRKALYAEGVTSLVELLDAERDLSQSRDLYAQALINVQAGIVNVYKAKGTLLTEFLNTL
jgi:outer membrane protein